MKRIILALLLVCGPLWGAEFKVGIGRQVITPALPIWLSGYASRTNPATGVIHDLWAKALVLEETPSRRVAIVTTDLIGLPHEVSDEVAKRVKKKYGLNRSQLLLNSSHTHSGPVVWPNLSVLFNMNPEALQRAVQYSQKLTEDLVAVVGMALSNRAPAQVSCGHGSAEFAKNRREPLPKGVIIGVNQSGPTDHDVPVLKIATPDGKLRAVLFGYACHNTTLGGDRYLINGDYAGFAQIEFEQQHPGVTAMFLMLCGADQNPQPRGKVELAEQHGKSLTEAVNRVLAGELRLVRPSIRTAYQEAILEFAPHDRTVFEAEAKDPDRYRQRRAKLMIEDYDQGRPIRQLAYPVQGVRFGDDLTILALAGEVVVDYALSAKRAYANENLIVAGYCNEVPCYIPSKRVLAEGGYEPVNSMIYYAQPGPFKDNVEEKVFETIRQVMKRTGAKAAQAR